MRPSEKIDSSVKKMNFSAGAELRKQILDDALKAHQRTETQPAFEKPNIWRIIMKSRMTKLAAAAVIAIVGIASWAIFHHDVERPMLSSIELLKKAQAAEKTLFSGDKIIHIMSEMTIYRSQYNPKSREMIEKLGDTKLSVEELDKMNRELISSWLVSWLPMMSLQPNGEHRLTEIQLAKDANQTYTIFDNAWYDPKTGKFVRTMDVNDKVIFANSYDGQFVNITETTADGKVHLKSEAVSANFKAPENPAEFLGMTAGVQQCMTDKCFSAARSGCHKRHTRGWNCRVCLQGRIPKSVWWRVRHVLPVQDSSGR